jgi:hypothetical protein
MQKSGTIPSKRSELTTDKEGTSYTSPKKEIPNDSESKLSSLNKKDDQKINV